jgi:hypothetical protein
MKEIYKSIIGYEGKYEVSNLGNVKSLERRVIIHNGTRLVKEKILKKGINTVGYEIVSLSINNKVKTHQIHQLVAEAFLKHSRCGYEKVVNHINFNKLDNRVENLEIVTQRENTNRKHTKSSSKLTGVSWHKRRKKWIATISINGKNKHLGYFKSEIEASETYQKKLKEIKL